MTVASTLSKAGPYACDGVQTRFPFDFAVLNKKHIAVYINSALVVSGYSVELVEDQEGGTVVMAAPPRAGASLIILRDVPFTQWTDLQNRTAFYPEVLETAYDKLTMICQQLRELLSRVVIVPPGVEPSWEELLNLLTKAGAEAQEAADRAQDILDKLLGMGLENMAPLDSPHFTGTPTAPTAGKGTSTDQIATTKFVQNEVADFLSAHNSAADAHPELRGRLDAIADHVVEVWTATDGSAWYRKYSSGWVEQGGTIPTGATLTPRITFPMQFANADYTILKSFSVHNNGADGGGSISYNQAGFYAKTATSAVTSKASLMDAAFWIAFGRAAEQE